MLADVVRVHFDGACEPPGGGGVATYGYLIDGAELHHTDRGLAVAPWSPRATNNVAEYTGAIRALEWLQSRGFRGTVLMFGDSQLVVRQMGGEYAVRAEHLKAYHDRLTALTRRFAEVRFRWVPRAENAEADLLSKQALAEAMPAARALRPGRGSPDGARAEAVGDGNSPSSSGR